jgi:metal-sulfur cluster biosynthetic enzyme
MFIQTEATADPARLKFLPGREVLAEGVLTFRDRAQAAASPLAERLFEITGVAAVSLGRESITVTRAGGDWATLKAPILAAIMDHFVSGEPVLKGGPSSPPATASEPEETGTLAAITEALRRVIDPELGYNIVDLGLVYDVEVDDAGLARITMTTTTPGCPATNYLKGGAGDSVSAVPGIRSVEVNLTYDPRWGPELMSPEAKVHFGMEA